MSTVPSPCINVCRMQVSSGLCEGCGRTLDEIAAWSGLDDEARRVVWRRIAERRGSAPDGAPASATPIQQAADAAGSLR